jgi:anti-sigma factor RsiW
VKSVASRRCRALLERLSMYIDNELAPADRAAVIRHLRHCPCCQNFVNGLRRTAVLCRQAVPRRLPPGLRARARARVADLLKTSPRRRSS